MNNFSDLISFVIDIILANRRVPGDEKASFTMRRKHGAKMARRFFRDMNVPTLRKFSDVQTVAGHLACLQGDKGNGWLPIKGRKPGLLDINEIHPAELIPLIDARGITRELISSSVDDEDRKFIGIAFWLACQEDVERALAD